MAMYQQQSQGGGLARGTNVEWMIMLRDLLTFGASRAPRGIPTRELLAYQTAVPMSNPVVTLAAREMGYRFLAAESAWILSGDNRVSSIRPYSKEISRFSDDGVTFFGAYGPRFVDQVGKAVEAIRADPDTRQAVCTLWRPSPPQTKDVPCTVALQWLLRDGAVDCVATMRSSDAWLGWVYDVHSFSMMSARVVLGLRHRAQTAALGNVVLGHLYLTAGSQHLYEKNFDAARAVLDGDGAKDWEPKPFDPDQFDHPDELARHLWLVAERHPDARNRGWLGESLK